MKSREKIKSSVREGEGKRREERRGTERGTQGMEWNGIEWKRREEEGNRGSERGELTLLPCF